MKWAFSGGRSSRKASGGRFPRASWGHSPLAVSSPGWCLEAPRSGSSKASWPRNPQSTRTPGALRGHPRLAPRAGPLPRAQWVADLEEGHLGSLLQLDCLRPEVVSGEAPRISAGQFLQNPRRDRNKRGSLPGEMKLKTHGLTRRPLFSLMQPPCSSGRSVPCALGISFLWRF
ncbi:MAG: hypothetical protein RLZZ253_2988 [Verrucomicrobiota bacterium]